MKKPTGRAPKKVGACYLKEVPYKGEYRVDLTARNPRLHKTFHNWRAAEEFATEETKRREVHGKITNHTFNDAANGLENEWQQRMRAKVPTLSPDTFVTYKRNLDRARAKFGKMKLAALKSQHCRDWLLELSQKYRPRLS